MKEVRLGTVEMDDKFTVAGDCSFTVLHWTNRLETDPTGGRTSGMEFSGPRRRPAGSTADDEGAAAARIADR
jgi:hypothetical protein